MTRGGKPRTPRGAGEIEIAFHSNRSGGGGDIYVMNADDSGQTRLTTGGAFDAEPSWSPVGTKIAFSSKGGYIWVMNTTAAARRG